MDGMRFFKRRNGIYYIESGRDKRRSLGTRDEAVAKKLFKEIQKEILLGRVVKLEGRQRLLLSDFNKKYLSDREGKNSVNTVRNDTYERQRSFMTMRRKQVSVSINFMISGTHAPPFYLQTALILRSYKRYWDTVQ